MITLAVDTCDGRGSVGVRLNGRCVGVRLHEVDEYSSWLLPAVESSLQEAGVSLEELDLLAVANGPGSFTGVRVGLCAVKAWAEVYGKRVVGVSRLEAMAGSVTEEGLVAACFDAHRGQMFAGLYRKGEGKLERVEEEMVVGAEEFVARVKELSGGEVVHWTTLDPKIIEELERWKEMASRGSTLLKCEGGLANAIGKLGEEKATRGEFTDIAELDANYVRRSDAEIYWKGPAYRGG